MKAMFAHRTLLVMKPLTRRASPRNRTVKGIHLLNYYDTITRIAHGVNHTDLYGAERYCSSARGNRQRELESSDTIKLIKQTIVKKKRSVPDMKFRPGYGIPTGPGRNEPSR